ncbi:trypsin-like peptidase domain-containing protein [Haladaptatus sp. DYF46]|uniref:S1C family serine protease n=1 Tax=Haladaptatus sp. DYF46 TaxID=2886041 RepID=UPI001E438975|nr:trypsin-like peptidase domain-containing protein [Haladaptatus sp. DYF46]
MGRKQRTRRQYLQLFGTGLTAATAGCASIGSQDTSSTPESTTGTAKEGMKKTTSQPQTKADNTSSVYTRVYQETIGSVVLLRISAGQKKGLGSGFVFDDKHIITNYHVVKDVDTVDVQFTQGESQVGTVVGKDPYSDLAVVSVSNRPKYAKKLPFLEQEPAVGRKVAAIGSPYGLEGSLSEGIVSGVNRFIPSPGSPLTIPNAIQTDAAVNPGNSGGPLMTLNKKVVGVINSGGGDNVAFAIPANLVNRVVPGLIKNGKYKHPYLGAQLADVTAAVATAYDLSSPRGVLVTDVQTNGPAAGVLDGSAGQTTVDGIAVPTGGDIILRIDGKKMSSPRDVLQYLILKKSPGETITVSFLEDGEKKTKKLTLGSRSSNNSVEQRRKPSVQI